MYYYWIFGVLIIVSLLYHGISLTSLFSYLHDKSSNEIHCRFFARIVEICSFFVEYSVIPIIALSLWKYPTSIQLQM